MNGHTITNRLHTGREAKDFCPTCGLETISKCPSCGEEIQGWFVKRTATTASFSRKFESFPPKPPSKKPPAFCHYCGKPFPWTEKKLEAVDELVDELKALGLSPHDGEVLKTSLHDLIQQNQHQEVAELKLRKILAKVGEEGLVWAKTILYKVLTDVVFKRLFGVS